MAVYASAVYKVTHTDGTKERIEASTSTDAAYSPDIASDLLARARRELGEVYAATWPAPSPVTE